MEVWRRKIEDRERDEWRIHDKQQQLGDKIEFHRSVRKKKKRV